MQALRRGGAGKALREEVGLPIHFHTHDTSAAGLASALEAGRAGARVVDAALAPFSGLTSQPNLNALVEATRHTPLDTGLDPEPLRHLAGYWAAVREHYTPFECGLKAPDADLYLHEMPGGQFTNLKEQAASMGLSHRWPEIARCYAEVNQLFGDIVKVTPSSKVVGDMALFLFTRGIKPAYVLNLEPGTAFPESVKDMLAGGLGEPMGGWPKKLVEVVLGKSKPAKARAPKVDLDEVRAELAAKLKREPTEDDLYSHLMYPGVFADFWKITREYGNVSKLPTPAFFYGLKYGEEIAIDIEQGKTLFVKLINVG